MGGPGRDSKQATFEYKSEALLPVPNGSVLYSYALKHMRLDLHDCPKMHQFCEFHFNDRQQNHARFYSEVPLPSNRR